MTTTPLKSEPQATAAYSYIILAPDEIEGAFYDEVIPRLKKYSAKSDTSVNFDHIYFQLVSGAFSLGIISKDAKIIGIAITSNAVESLTGYTGVHVVFLSCNNGHKILNYLLEVYDEMAEHFGYSFIHMNSTRKGFARKQVGGWKPLPTLWGKSYGRGH